MNKLIHPPGHVAFIMDGNGRWAEKRGLSRIEGHRAGVESARSAIKYLLSRHIKYASLYGFSTENWNRPADEVNALLQLLGEALEAEGAGLHEQGVRLKHIGQIERLPPGLQQSIKKVVELTGNDTAMTLSIAFNYGGRLEILDAVKGIINDGVAPEKIDEKLFGRFLYTAGLPDVDLVIRTGGEIRISNFLLWQTAYSEFYFTPVLWPDFNETELDKALEEYSRRQRRFGGL